VSAVRTAPGFAVSWERVSFAYQGADVVREVSLGVESGDAVALLGRNGAGKTTLVRMLVGLARPREGRVSVGDWDVATRRPDQMARRVGYAIQHADLQLFARTIAADVAFGPRQLGIGTGHVPVVLEELGLSAVAGRHPYDQPVPVRKLVALAGVLAMRPGVLVLDEPTAGMDADLRGRVVGALRRRNAAGVTVIVVTHDPALVRAVARREVTLDAGRIRVP
jgi:energy-coupling factor transport system ATP-binding protein